MGVIALAGTMALAQGAAPSTGSRTDGQIEMDVVHALDASQALKDDMITAATIQSEVTLSGTVSSDSSKQLAESIAKTVPGVTKVHNNLKVGNPADDANAQGAPANDPSNDMADAQGAPAPAQGAQDNGQYAGSAQNAPSINEAPPPNWGGQNQQQPAYGQNPPASRVWTGSSASGIRAGRTASWLWTSAASAGVWPEAGLCAGSSSAAICNAAGAGHSAAGNFDPGADE